ncbi:alpha/beta hydrolase [Allokutzneria multivorans]|uniref:Alpha/beta hydrolase n=1 Tax=Allokutzneria multivorans TaxID=1142134 RepID=A0ABP7SJS0_9PSEU
MSLTRNSVLLAFVLALLPAPASAQPADLTDTAVSFRSGEHTLNGTVVAPTGAGDRPGVVIVAGAGHTRRDSYRPEAEALARAGIAALIYDKRPGYSRATATINDLADDALAAAAALRGFSRVNRVGLWGHSQGGWVVPLAASKSPEVAFVITVGASAMDAARTQLWSNRTYLSHAGVSERVAKPIGANLSRMLMGVGLFGDTAYDPVATLAKLRQPLLGVFADNDRSTAPGESLAAFREALERGGNKHYSLRVVSEANHNLRRSEDGFGQLPRTAEFAPGYVELMASWITGGTTAAPSADSPPAQAIRSEPVTLLAWYESPWLHVGAVVLMLLVFLAYPIIALVRRLRGRRAPAPVGWPARFLAAGGIVTVLGSLVFLFSIVQTGATGVQSSVLGRPLPWLLLQIAAVGVLIATVFVVVRRRAELREMMLIAGAVVFVPWAAYWGLLTV